MNLLLIISLITYITSGHGYNWKKKNIDIKNLYKTLYYVPKDKFNRHYITGSVSNIRNGTCVVECPENSKNIHDLIENSQLS